MKLKHDDNECDGEIRAVNELYGSGKPSVFFECSKCGQHVGSLPDCVVIYETQNGDFTPSAA